MKKKDRTIWEHANYHDLEALFAPTVSSRSQCRVEACGHCEVWILARKDFDNILGKMGPSELATTVKVIRSKVQFHNDSASWVMDVSDKPGKSECVELSHLVQHGIPDQLKAACTEELRRLSSFRNALGRPVLTRRSKYMISGRFNTRENMQNCMALKQELEDLGFAHILLVHAESGDQFGPLTTRYLYECDAMIGMLTEDYAEKTKSAYCSYYELKHYVENRYGCGSSQILKFFPIKLCSTWPPKSKGEDGAQLSSLAFTQDMVYTIDMYGQAFDAKLVARAIAMSHCIAKDEACEGGGTATPVSPVSTAALIAVV